MMSGIECTVVRQDQEPPPEIRSNSKQYNYISFAPPPLAKGTFMPHADVAIVQTRKLVALGEDEM